MKSVLEWISRFLFGAAVILLGIGLYFSLRPLKPAALAKGLYLVQCEKTFHAAAVGSRPEVQYTLVNPTAEPIQIVTAFQLSCGPWGCGNGDPNRIEWAPGLFPLTIPPRGQREVTLSVKAAYPEKFDGYLLMYANDRPHSELSLRIKGQILAVSRL